MLLPDGYHWDDQLQLGRETAQLTARVWPKFLVAESDLPQPGLKFQISAEEFQRRFPLWGIRRNCNRQLVAFANAAQVTADLERDELPATGWQYAIRAASESHESNCLCLLVANVDPAERGLGLAHILINRVKQATREMGFKDLIAPLRPTLKHRAPFAPTSAYLNQRSESGGHYDTWINLHVRSGGQIVNVCSQSVQVRATLNKWREWTGLPLNRSGDHVLPDGLVPLKVDLYRNLGEYSEPGVWVRYAL
jgi:GNAT superfamily N-acetyltransferase